MTIYFRFLATFAGLGPGSHVMVHRPYETRTDQFECSSDSGCNSEWMELKTARRMSFGTNGRGCSSSHVTCDGSITSG